jgi:ATP-dependent protease ClpP protease subunit
MAFAMKRLHCTILSGFVLVTMALTVTGQVFGAVRPLERFPNVWALTDEISSQDVAELMTHPNLKARRPIILELDSEGGDISAAMKIGRLLRDTRSSVIVREGNSCLSACVLVLAGATGRIVSNDASIGIHRPYSTSREAASYESVRTRYKALELGVRTYLEEMNVPNSLFDAMLRIPPEDVRILSREELLSFGLNSDDPVKAEYDDLQNAREYGVDRTEYLRRKRLAESCSAFFPPDSAKEEFLNDELARYDRCREAILRTGKWDGR